LLVAEYLVDAHRGHFVLDRGFCLLLQLECDQSHGIFGVAKVEFLIGDGDVVHDPLDVGLHDHTLKLAADAVGVEQDGLHRSGYHEKRVAVGVVAERNAKSNVDGLASPPARVHHEGVRGHQDGLPPSDARDAHGDSVGRPNGGALRWPQVLGQRRLLRDDSIEICVALFARHAAHPISQVGRLESPNPTPDERTPVSMTRVARREAEQGGARRVKRKKKKKRDPGWAKFLVIFGAMLMIVSGSGIALAHSFIGKATGSIQQQNLLGEAVLSGNNIDGPINMLLVGIDVRPDQKDDSVRADTIIMLHIPASHDQAVLISIPRDTQVKIPDYPKTKFKGWTTKINAAFQGGYQGPGTEVEKRGRGTELLALTIKKTWGINFNGAAIIDFAGFEAVLKELGGVTMCVEREAEAIHLALDKNNNIVEVWYDDAAGEVKGIPPGGKKLIYKPGCSAWRPTWLSNTRACARAPVARPATTTGSATSSN
jgi:LCP family protein required for cell wall assembly